jgi:hypothetical protein
MMWGEEHGWVLVSDAGKLCPGPLPVGCRWHVCITADDWHGVESQEERSTWSLEHFEPQGVNLWADRIPFGTWLGFNIQPGTQMDSEIAAELQTHMCQASLTL